MIQIGDKQFGHGAKSVSSPVIGKTLDGYYKRLKRGIKFFMPDGTLFAYLCANDTSSCFFVNACVLEGKTYYQYSTGSHVEARLGIAGMAHGQLYALATAIWKAK